MSEIITAILQKIITFDDSEEIKAAVLGLIMQWVGIGLAVGAGLLILKVLWIFMKTAASDSDDKWANLRSDIQGLLIGALGMGSTGTLGIIVGLIIKNLSK